MASQSLLLRKHNDELQPGEWVRERLKRLPASYDSHDVVPLPPPEDGIPVGQVLAD